MEYEGYFNNKSVELFRWATDELSSGNRTKASKIKKVADGMEYKYRQTSEHKAMVDGRLGYKTLAFPLEFINGVDTGEIPK